MNFTLLCIYQILLSKVTYTAFRLYIFLYVCSLGIEPTTFCADNAMLYHRATGTQFLIWSELTMNWLQLIITYCLFDLLCHNLYCINHYRNNEDFTWNVIDFKGVHEYAICIPLYWLFKVICISIQSQNPRQSVTIKWEVLNSYKHRVNFSSFSDIGNILCCTEFIWQNYTKIIHLYLVILQMLLSKAKYNCGIHKVINLEEANRQKCS